MKQSNFFEFVHDGNQLSYKMMSLFLKQFNHKVNISQIILLEYIKRNGASQPSTIAKALGFTDGAITTMTNKLVKMEYINRVPQLIDRRVILLNITPSGISLLKEAEITGEKVRNAVYSVLTAEELTLMKEIQKKLLNHVDSIDEI
ncbi:MarR family winged helix-turn-helix transcriptional regulator [Macrococcoides canis]|uniref:MarR family transcriptional regulator n=1 Tax=Macrococcoides canis TaxID=1855823 RepID=A0A4R6C3M6_9STAP|nr:MarR family transcriptional regulator [Macrococcus canis]MEE1107177.1 MarR family transcriptional regulator [Macrococcus canis]TDM16093.1 MarR family transcriptional regulator [Macrococcus canis]TDM20155.1 MarR family transcriptional regulator [Macrococcus canis]TDM23057.1 MarR family transcriptional regulator [Macrococcus canis]TDM30899.1 MarR family transcriptional regulator [Macrococcus canis]